MSHDQDPTQPPPQPSQPAVAARAAMIDGLRSAGTLQTPSVSAAMASVPRHRFIEGVTNEEAYADNAIVVKRDDAGTAISSASQPTIVAAMLELCRLEPGHRVLEIGTGTGYNAALVATIVGLDDPDGSDGRVVSIELDDDLAEAARHRLAGLGLDRVRVVTGDGVTGHPDGQPFDAVVVTTGAPSIAPAWIEQLAVGGRLVVPVVGADGIGAISCLAKRADGIDEVATVPCGFLPMRAGS